MAGKDGFVSASKLKTELVRLKGGASVEYVLEWSWHYDGINDKNDTKLGKGEHREHIIKAEITIETFQ